jgi:hypothetical protein
MPNALRTVLAIVTLALMAAATAWADPVITKPPVAKKDTPFQAVQKERPCARTASPAAG